MLESDQVQRNTTDAEPPNSQAGHQRPATTGWARAENAFAYARFCGQFPQYRDMSEDLAALVGLETAQLAVDLGCGTGVSTRAILARLPPTGRVVALDSSEAMLGTGRSELVEPRVRWVRARAEALASHLEEPADAVLCNSAFWQMDMSTVLDGVARALRPGGRFAFNIPGLFMRLPPSDAELQRSTPTLFELMWAAAVLHHGLVPRRPHLSEGSRPFTMDSATALLEAAGLQVEQAQIIEYDYSPESVYAWLSIPIFTERQFGHLSYQQRMEALATAYERVDRDVPERSRWAVFVARAPSARSHVMAGDSRP
jgi:SAM-dependent methyltransferase